MKTYTQTWQKPLLKIEPDDCMESPRHSMDNLGFFITRERNHSSPDNAEDLISLINNASEESTNTKEHMENIKTEMKYNGYGEVLAIHPVYKYEHGNVAYRIGKALKGFDYSDCGFYIVTDKTQKTLGTAKKDFKKLIDRELEMYTQWANGEIYQFVLYNKRGDVEEACGGFYNIEDMRGYLPKEWKDEDLMEYLIK